jgi:hypothetical protein
MSGHFFDLLNSKAVVSAVHKEAELREEVHADERMCDVGHHEPPCEIPA